MAAQSLDLAVPDVLGRYAVAPGSRLVSLGNHGGFSGARLWRVEGTAEPRCVRAWPSADTTPQRLEEIHRLMGLARAAGLEFVPAVFATREGTTWVEHAGRLWDVTAWLPGRADFHDRPTAARMQAACTALARLHLVWAQSASGTGPCPGVQRRLETYREWTALVRSGWRPLPSAATDPVAPWAERAWRLLEARLERVPRLLRPWADRPLPLQPCLGDVWHDHVLFEGDRVTGLIDYGGVKRDHVAVDLARLLGSMAGDDAALRAAGLHAYSRLRPLSIAEEALVAVLDETGTLLGAANWLKRLYRERGSFEDPAAVARRLAALVERMEGWQNR